MTDVQKLLDNPLLAAAGLVVLLLILLLPLALRLAGLTGAQILELLRATMAFIIEAIKTFRSTNNGEPPQS